ncbi:putative ribonuclease H-like domain-containing protein [Tanacetum coccineum]
MSKQSQEIQDHVMIVNMEAQNLSETKLQGRLLASKYQVKQGSSFQVKVIPGSDRKPALSFMRPFGCPVTIFNTMDHLGKFDGKAIEGFFVGYSTNSKAFRVFNSTTRIVEENPHVQFRYQSNGSAGTKACDNVGKARVETVSGKDYILLPLWTQDPPFSSSLKDSPDAGFKPSGEEEKKDDEDPGNEDCTEEPRVNQEKDVNFNITNNINTVSPTDNAASLNKNNAVDENIVYEELLQFKLQEVLDIRRVNLDGKRAYRKTLNGSSETKRMKEIKEEVYVCQPPGFEDPDFPDRVYKVEKALYGLHQAPRAWYETLSTYLLDNGFQRGKIDKTLFIKRDKSDISLQVQQKEDGIFISQDKYVNKILNKYGFSDVKIEITPMETHKTLLKDTDGEDVDEHFYRSMIGSLMYLTSLRPDIMFADSPFYLVAYTYSDYAGASLDRKSTIRGCQFLGCRLISWQCKKQTVVANSTTEAEYIAASNCCGQATTKVKTVNREVQIQALVDKKKVIITEISIRSNLQLEDVEAYDNVPTHSNDPLLSGEDRLKPNELMELCTNLSQRVLDLEKTKTSQAIEITELKKRFKKLEKKGESRTHRLRRLYKVGRSARVVSSEDEEVTLVDETQGRYGDNLMFDTNVLDNEEVFVEQDMAEKEVDMAEKDVSIADLVTTTAQLEAELEEEKKLVRQREEDANIAEWDDVQAIMDADYELGARLQADEQGKLTIKERSRLFMELMDKRKKHFARLRAEEQRRKPPTKAPKKNQMCTYLKKHGWIHSQSVEEKIFDEVQNETKTEESSKIAREELESKNLKKQKLDDNVESKVDDEAEVKKHMEIVPDDEVAIDAIPLATKPPIIVD